MMMMMGTFAVLAWFGSLIDNLLLTYLIGQCVLRNCQTSSELLWDDCYIEQIPFVSLFRYEIEVKMVLVFFCFCS